MPIVRFLLHTHMHEKNTQIKCTTNCISQAEYLLSSLPIHPLIALHKRTDGEIFSTTTHTTNTHKLLEKTYADMDSCNA